MSDGLSTVKFAILKQEVDPLEWCVCMMPIPCKIGLPCFPCDMPNNFFLFQANEEFTQIGMKILDIEESSTLAERTACCASWRSFEMNAKNFYNETVLKAERPFNIPLLSYCRPEFKITYLKKYIGKIQEPCSWQICKGLFHELYVFDADNLLIYRIRASLKQPGIFCFLPLKDCSEIVYEILDTFNNELGYIKHMFNGCYNEVFTKSDKYGIAYPLEASEEQKVLITMAAIFIDYLWFENN